MMIIYLMLLFIPSMLLSMGQPTLSWRERLEQLPTDLKNHTKNIIGLPATTALTLPGRNIPLCFANLDQNGAHVYTLHEETGPLESGTYFWQYAHEITPDFTNAAQRERHILSQSIMLNETSNSTVSLPLTLWNISTGQKIMQHTLAETPPNAFRLLTTPFAQRDDYTTAINKNDIERDHTFSALFNANLLTTLKKPRTYAEAASFLHTLTCCYFICDPRTKTILIPTAQCSAKMLQPLSVYHVELAENLHNIFADEQAPNHQKRFILLNTQQAALFNSLPPFLQATLRQKCVQKHHAYISTQFPREKAL